jgi:photosystem I subunit 3
VAGWIGSVGREYLNTVKSSEKEIIIDVPLALNLMFAAGAWPLLALREAQAGTLFADDADITVSPR